LEYVLTEIGGKKMIKELVFVPAVAILVLGFMTQLSDIATSTSDKALNYADQMDSAVDCAFRAMPIEDCSPDLTKTTFEPETREVISLNKRMIEEFSVDIEETFDNMTETNTTG
jgi:hypothetical protein